ncbi:hypothetical protein K474DRAFT_1680363 [Panus rudis PR-1116 ss-1]|nr:hypothetical protein K474DRAFT_1680363 [Panus rudis PR-1116 ss-1]
MYLPFQLNTHSITLALLGLTCASVHVARAYPMPLEGSVAPHLEDMGLESRNVALSSPRDDENPSREHSLSMFELHTRFNNLVNDLEARHDGLDTDVDTADRLSLFRRGWRSSSKDSSTSFPVPPILSTYRPARPVRPPRPYIVPDTPAPQSPARPPRPNPNVNTSASRGGSSSSSHPAPSPGANPARSNPAPGPGPVARPNPAVEPYIPQTPTQAGGRYVAGAPPQAAIVQPGPAAQAVGFNPAAQFYAVNPNPQPNPYSQYPECN